MEGEKFTLRHIEGQLLLRYAASRLPAQMMLLRRGLRVYSPVLQKHQKPCFGDGDNWREEKTDDGTVWKMIDPEREIEIKLDEEAVSGAYWALLIMAHP